MKYKVHKLRINLEKEPQQLEKFLNSLKGQVISVIPDVKPFFLCYGAKTRTIVIVEKKR